MLTLRCFKTWLCPVLMVAVLGHFGLGHRDLSTFVLCFGADGHVALERIGLNSTANPDKTVQPTIKADANIAASDSPCNSPCTDIPIGEDGHITYLSLSDLSKATSDFGFIALFSLIFLCLFHDCVVIQRRVFSDPAFTDPRLLALSSIILRI